MSLRSRDDNSALMSKSTRRGRLLSGRLLRSGSDDSGTIASHSDYQQDFVAFCATRQVNRNSTAPQDERFLSNAPCRKDGHDANDRRRAAPRAPRPARPRASSTTPIAPMARSTKPRRCSSGRTTASGASPATPTSRRCCATAGSAARYLHVMSRAELGWPEPKPHLAAVRRARAPFDPRASSRPSTRGCATSSIAPSSRAGSKSLGRGSRRWRTSGSTHSRMKARPT